MDKDKSFKAVKDNLERSIEEKEISIHPQSLND